LLQLQWSDTQHHSAASVERLLAGDELEGTWVMRYDIGSTILTIAALLPAGFSLAAEPVLPPRTIEHEALAELGDAVARVALYRDNFYRYESRVAELTESAAAMEGGTVEVLLLVRRVSPSEVFVERPHEHQTRMILKHTRPPLFGNLKTVWYCAQPSADYWHMLAGPVGLRIGEEISLEVAKQLRKHDALRIVGRIESMPIRMNGVFQPRVAAVIVDWKVVEIIPVDDTANVRY
jgi:hypothetical protein